MKPFCYHSFDLRQLVSFVEIARAGSFRQAAKTLHIAQPALSRQIQQLEAALGISLFDRAPRRLHLTIEGREIQMLGHGRDVTQVTQTIGRVALPFPSLRLQGPGSGAASTS